jgi:adenylate kinase family enzyme
VTPCRLHITGASGSGTTTLGRALASAWSVPHADADDYFWLPTSPPFMTKRDAGDRRRLMDEMFLGRDGWVLSGSVTEWGDPLLDHFDAVVFLSLDNEVRMERLRARELTRSGEAIRDGGAREAAYRNFIDWANAYEDPEFNGRSRTRHEQWLSSLPCPVLRLDSARPVDELVSQVVAWGCEGVAHEHQG